MALRSENILWCVFNSFVLMQQNQRASFFDPPPQVQRWHQGNEHFGRVWQTGDVVGCMVDLNERTMLFTLNGEVLLDDSGSELAFKDFEVGQGQCFSLPHSG